MKQVLFLALMLGGCVYVPRVVKLEQPDPGQPSPICIQVEPFSDTRVDKTLIGVVRNGFYWPEGNARTEGDVARWITDHLRASLTPESCVPEFSLQGRVREVFVDEWFNLNARIVVSLRLERQQTVILERDLEVTYSQLSHLGSNSEFEETLRKALAAFGQRAIPAVIAAAADAPSTPAL